MTYIQEQIRQEREARGLTQSKLGNRIGQPQSAVSRIERGGDLRVSTLLEMARVLELEPMLIPKRLVPAGQERSSTSNADSIPLVGGVPEDAEDDNEDHKAARRIGGTSRGYSDRHPH
jgi:transcriptional regulator with XRE-family HTH domain